MLHGPVDLCVLMCVFVSTDLLLLLAIFFNSLPTGLFGMLFCHLLDFFFQLFRKIITGNTIRVSNSLDPDQA